jgi:DNA-binding transcriptional regulator LsrR (DeoR family)
MYYEEELTQREIADRLDISRIRVSRYLQQARATGVATVWIRYAGLFVEEEAALRALFPGVRFIIADALDGTGPQVRDAVATTAADYLATVLRPEHKVAVGWGETMHLLAAKTANRLAPAEFIPLIGGQGSTALDVHATLIAHALAQGSGGRALPLLAPAVAQSVEQHKMIIKDPGIRTTLAAARRADYAIYSVQAPLSPDATIGRAGYFTAADLEILRHDGVLSDLVSICYLNERAQPTADSLSRRAVALPRDQLRAIPTKVIVGGGLSKAAALRIAIWAGYADVVITDHLVARRLMEERLTAPPTAVDRLPERSKSEASPLA